jgi:hypothetical protein
MVVDYNTFYSPGWPIFQAALAMALSSGAAWAAGEDVYSPFGLSCRPVAHSTEATEKVSESLGKRYTAVWGKDWAGRPTPQQRIDPKAMAEIAAIAGCAALLDQSSCTTFYDPEFGGEVTAFTDLSTKVPVRRQFDEAIAALPSEAARKAAQSCIKRVARK